MASKSRSQRGVPVKRCLLLLSLLSGCAIAAGNTTIDSIAVSASADPMTVDWGNREFYVAVEVTDTTQAAQSVAAEAMHSNGRRYSGLVTSSSPVDGDTNLWTVIIQIPQHTDSGTVTLNRVTVYDATSVRANVYRDEIIADIPNIIASEEEMSIDVVRANSSYTGPSVGPVEMSQVGVNSTTGEMVTCTVPNTGYDSVTLSAFCKYADPSGDLYTCAGKGSCDLSVEPGAEDGYWTLQQVTVVDTLGNRTSQTTAEVAASGGQYYLDVNPTGSSGGGGAGGAGTYDFCGQTPTNTVAGSGSDEYWNSTGAGGAGGDPGFTASDTLLFNVTARTNAAGAVVGIGETATNTLAAFNAAIRFDASGDFTAWNGSTWQTAKTPLAWAADTWYKFRIYADVFNEEYYAEVAACNGGDDYYWIGSHIPMSGTPTTLNYQKVLAPDGVTALTHSPDWFANRCEWPACGNGTLSVDVSGVTEGCGNASWSIEPGAYSGSASWGPTSVGDATYTITWEDSDIGCSAPVLNFANGGRSTVFDDAQTFALSTPNYVALSTYGATVRTCLDGDCTPPGNEPPVASWSIAPTDAAFAGQYSDSGSGDEVAAAQPLYIGREYTITCDAEAGYSATPATADLTITSNPGANVFFCQWNTL